MEKPPPYPSPATLRRSPPDRLIARRWASFVGPLRAKEWRADDFTGPAGRTRIRARLRKPTCGNRSLYSSTVTPPERLTRLHAS
jgi:hypothetical protein